MSRFSSIITPKKLSLVAYPDDYQIANLQIKLPAMLEYLYEPTAQPPNLNNFNF